MLPLMPCRTLSISIACDPQRVYDFVSDLANLPRWGTTFVRSIRREGAEWIAQTPQGPVTMRIAPRNAAGILDHHVITAEGVDVFVPMRVVSNGSGSELLFTLFRQAGMSDEQYAADAALVQQDLATLKHVLEAAGV